MIYPKSYTSLGQEKGPGLSFPYFTEEDTFKTSGSTNLQR